MSKQVIPALIDAASKGFGNMVSKLPLTSVKDISVAKVLADFNPLEVRQALSKPWLPLSTFNKPSGAEYIANLNKMGAMKRPWLMKGILDPKSIERQAYDYVNRYGFDEAISTLNPYLQFAPTGDDLFAITVENLKAANNGRPKSLYQIANRTPNSKNIGRVILSRAGIKPGIRNSNHKSAFLGNRVAGLGTDSEIMAILPKYIEGVSPTKVRIPTEVRYDLNLKAVAETFGKDSEAFKYAELLTKRAEELRGELGTITQNSLYLPSQASVDSDVAKLYELANIENRLARFNMTEVGGNDVIHAFGGGNVPVFGVAPNQGYLALQTDFGRTVTNPKLPSRSNLKLYNLDPFGNYGEIIQAEAHPTELLPRHLDDLLTLERQVGPGGEIAGEIIPKGSLVLETKHPITGAPIMKLPGLISYAYNPTLQNSIVLDHMRIGKNGLKLIKKRR